jgi:RNA polymerase sigma-70 factor, ECF subfamily
MRDPRERAAGPLRSTDAEDQALALRAGRGDRAAFELLASRWWDRLRSLAAVSAGLDPVAAEEAAEDALVRIYEALPRFRGDSAFGTFAYRVCCRAAADAARRRSRERRRSARRADGEALEPGDLVDPARGPEEESLRAAEIAALGRALALLKPEDRSLLHLYEAEGLGVDELSRVFGVAIGTIKSRLFRARSRLGEALKEEGYGDA